MATRVMTRTGSVTQVITQQPAQHPPRTEQTNTRAESGQTNTPEESEQTIAQSEINAFLDRIPRLERFLRASPTPRTLRLVLRSNTIARSGGSGFSGSPSTNSTDLPVNILVLELGEVYTKRRILSLSDLRSYLRGNTPPRRRVFLVSDDSLTDEVVGQLGYRLRLDPDFFATHTTAQELPLELSLPSSIVSRQSIQFDYFRQGTEAKKERMSLSVSQKTEHSWTCKLELPFNQRGED
jgi:hypothetical protein